jgi:hypothetical protein
MKNNLITLRIMTLIITNLSIMTLSLLVLSRIMLIIIKLSLPTLSITAINIVTLKITEKRTVSLYQTNVMLGVSQFGFCADCLYTKCRGASNKNVNLYEIAKSKI